MRRPCAFLLLVALAAAGEKELKRDDGDQKAKASRAGTGHVVTFDVPRGGWWVRAVAVYGQRYGGGYDPSETTFTVTICDGDGKTVGTTTAKYELFAAGRFEWVEVPLDEPVRAPAVLKVIVEFRPTGTKGVYVGHDGAKGEHSAYGVPGGQERPFDHEWMIRARLTSAKPKAPKTRKPDKAAYVADFEFLAKTVKRRFPALEKKGVDWDAACKEWKGTFAAARDDREHVRNAMRLLALLGDMHSGVLEGHVETPAFDGLFGAGLWIAADRGRLVLRAATPGHPLLDRVKPGAELLAIDGRPARLLHLAARAQLKSWFGWSSDHFLDARLSFQFFPFGKAERISATFLDPSGGVVEVELERWGPGGRGLSRVEATMPEGVRAEGAAVSARLDERTGYLRILGGMDEKTREAFDVAFDALKGVDGIVLDCRGMGGGGDPSAWAMAGRFFEKRVGTPPIEPTGSWQFEGPVVMLQDERMVSSAETFTWAMMETGRALSVGRPTGGATIIPESFDAPSGLFRFRVGAHDRKTPLLGVQPEGVGTAPDVFVAYEPSLLAKHRDPVLAVAREALDLLRKGEERKAVVARLTAPPTEEALAWQIRLLEEPRNPMPDFVRACGWLEEVAGSPDRDLAARAREARAAWRKEAEAQEECELLLAKGFPPDAAEAKAFLASHKGTRWADALAAYLR